MAGAIQLNLDGDQAQLLLRILQESVDDFCDDRPEYQRSSVPDDYDEKLRNKTYDDYGALLTLVQTVVEA